MGLPSVAVRLHHAVGVAGFHDVRGELDNHPYFSPALAQLAGQRQEAGEALTRVPVAAD